MSVVGATLNLYMKSAKSGANVKFEVALAELEKIVGEMESADLALEKLIERYEEGMRLVKICGDKLAEAEQKITVLTQNRPSLSAPLAEEEKASSPEATESDVRLF